MESNGKRVDREGRVLPYATSAVVWGEPGTNGQHAYFQMLHQGTDTIPVEFILVRKADARRRRPSGERIAGTAAGDAARQRAGAIAGAHAGAEIGRPHRDFPGNRPSTTFVLERLTPRSLGALIGLYEHRVFTAGAVWGIDSFDQWGVELGKVLGTVCCRCSMAPTSRPPGWTARRRGCCGGCVAEPGAGAGHSPELPRRAISA